MVRVMANLTSRVVLLLFLLVFFSTSCIEKFNKLEVELNPGVIVPIGSVSLSIGEMMEAVDVESILDSYKDVELNENSDKSYTVVFSQDSVTSVSLFDKVEIPKSPITFGSSKVFGTIRLDAKIEASEKYTLHALLTDFFDIDSIDLGFIKVPVKDVDGQLIKLDEEISNDTREFPLSTELGYNYEYMDLESGEVSLTLTNNLPSTISIFCDIFDPDVNTTLAILNFDNVSAGDPRTERASLAGKRLSKNTKIRILSVKMEETPGPVLINLEDFIEIEGGLNNLVLSGGKAELPSQSPIDSTNKVELSFDEVKRLDELQFENGEMAIDISSPFALNGKLVIDIPSMLDADGNPEKIVLDFDNSKSESERISMKDYKLLFNQNESGKSNIEYSYSFELLQSDGLVEFKSTDSISFSFSIKKYDFSFIVGDFGQQKVDIEPTRIKLPISVDFLGAQVFLENPVLNLNISSNSGLPASFSGNFSMYDWDPARKKELRIPNLIFPVATYPSTNFVTSSQPINKSNSNIVEFLSESPASSINYSASVQLNPNGDASVQVPNYIHTNSVVTVGFDMNIPLDFRLTNVDVDTTAAMDFSILDSISGSDLKLVFVLENGFPFEGEASYELIDSITNTNVLDRIELFQAEAAVLKSNGSVEQMSINSKELSYTKEEIEQIKTANKVRVSIKFTTPNNGDSPGKILSDNRVNFRILYKTNFEIKN